MKTTQIALSALLALTALPSLAQHRAAAPAAPDYTFTGNLGIFSDYRFRGISQTNKKPAIQGGVDFAHSSGIYLGNWNSNVDSAMYNGANIEMDFYGGWKTTIRRLRPRRRRDLLLLPGLRRQARHGSRSTTPRSTSAAAGARSR